jgi:HSP20 family protein
MSENIATLETERQNRISPQPVCSGVYFTRFDTYETERELLFRCLMPYVELIHVEAQLRKGELVIRGKVRPPSRAVVKSSRPKALGHFYRSFAIDQPVAGDHVSAHFQDGLLTVRLPKRGVTRARGAEECRQTSRAPIE